MLDQQAILAHTTCRRTIFNSSYPRQILPLYSKPKLANNSAKNTVGGMKPTLRVTLMGCDSLEAARRGSSLAAVTVISS